jgi:dTDP-glucose 4,6-dehydratase/UDP-glucuronate decarboxylase
VEDVVSKAGLAASAPLVAPRADLDEIVRRSERALRELSGRTLLVAGAAGFLGAYLAHAVARANDVALERSCSLVLLDNFATGSLGRLAPLDGRRDCRIVRRSLEELDGVAADTVVHAASIASPAVYRRLPLETIEVNVLGTWRLLRLAQEAGVRSLLYLSSSEVYGDPSADAIPTPEDYAGRVSFTGPRACYDESKRLAETLCRLYFERHDLPVKVARPFNVYGPTLSLDDGRVIPDLVRQAVAGGPLVLHSDGTPTRSFCYVTDAIAAFLELLVSDHEGEPFNVGNPEEVTMSDLARVVADVAGIHDIRHERADDDRYLVDNPQRRCPDIRKITATTAWRPQVSLREGIRRTLAHHGVAGKS